MEQELNQYGAVAKVLHWLIAVLIYAEWLVGTTLDSTQWYFLHFQMGSLILALVVIRILWKLTSGYPKMDVSLSTFNRFAASFGHSILYLLMLAVPCLGLTLVLTHGSPMTLLGITVPSLVEQPLPHATRHIIKEFHEYCAWTLVIFSSMHGLIAILHYLRHKTILGRMVPHCIMNLIENK